MMRLSNVAAFALTTLFLPVAMASENATFSLTLNALKLGTSSSKSEPAAGESSTQKIKYADVLGSSAEDNQPAFFELGLQYDKNVLYFYPLGSLGEREFWLGRELLENLEAGVVFSGYSKSYEPSVAIEDDPSKRKSSNAVALGIFTNYAFEAIGQGWELSAVPYYTSEAVKFEESSSNTRSEGSGLSVEIVMVREVTPNLAFAAGFSFDWEKTNLTSGGRKVSTTTDSDIGLHLGRMRFSF
jgi:hypothetical protein